MNSKLIVKIVFYIAIIVVAVAGGVLIQREMNKPEPAPYVAEPINYNTNTDVTNSNTNANTPKNPNTNTEPTKTETTPKKVTCIITIEGRQYDVAPIRKTHEGGDIFKCDTDMSSIFRGQHGTSFKMIEPFLVK